jgi:hypothetical protein
VTIQGLRAGDSVDSALTVTAQVTGGTPTDVRFLIDGTELGVATVAPYQINLEPAALAQGDHTLRVEAMDANGLLASSETAFAASPASPPAPGGASKTPFFIALMAVTAGIIGVVYVLQRRRPRVGRKIVEVRLATVGEQRRCRRWNVLLDRPILTPWNQSRSKNPSKLIIVEGPNVGKEYTVEWSGEHRLRTRWCEITFLDDDDSIGPEEARAWVHQDKLIFHKLTRLSLLASEARLAAGLSWRMETK